MPIHFSLELHREISIYERHLLGNYVNIGNNGSTSPAIRVSQNGICFQNNASGSAITQLTYYEEYSGTYSFSGPWTPAQNATISITRFGNCCILRMATNLLGTATIPATYIATSTAIPTRFWPVITQQMTNCLVEDNGAFTWGTVELYSGTGDITIYKNYTTFSGSGTTGVYAFSFCYGIN